VRRLATFLGAILAVLLIGEGVVRLVATLKGSLPESPDRSLQREWNWAHRHLEAGRAILPGPGAYDPDLGWVLKCHLTDGDAEVNGVAVDPMCGSSTEPIPGVPRLLFVGDSYTFGTGVGRDQVFASLLETEFLPDWQVVNVAVPGHGPDQAVLMFEKFGVRYDPDVVVLGFYVRGFARLFSGFRSYAKPYFVLRKGHELDLQGVPVIRPEELYAKYVSGERQIPGWRYSYLLARCATLIKETLQDRRLSANDESWKLMAAILQRFRDSVVEAGARPFLLIIPNRPEDFRGSVYEALDQLAQDEARRLGIPFLSLADEFNVGSDGEPEEATYRSREVGGHFSAHGHRQVAELLYRSLDEAGLLSAAPERSQDAGR
jgi:lysophospholipase L1-like esterase